MYESVVCDHMPKIATARNKATNWNKGGMLGKKKVSIFSRKWVGRETGNRIFVGVALFFFFLNTAKQLRACSIQTGENFETLRSHLSKTSFPQVCPQPSVSKINHSW